MAIQDVTLAEIDSVVVEPMGGGRFRVEVAGSVTGEDCAVNLHPSIYLNTPETWVIEAIGLTERSSARGEPRPWQAAVELWLKPRTRKIAVKGRKGTVTRSVPW